MNVRILQRKQKAELVKVAIGVAKILGALQAVPRSSARVELMVAIHRAAQLVIQAQMVVVVVDTDMVQMAEVSLETMHLSIGKRVRQQKFHGGLLQITEEVILTAFAQSRRIIWISQRSASSGLHSSSRENIPFSRSSMTSPPA
jgi:hypothetical protein